MKVYIKVLCNSETRSSIRIALQDSENFCAVWWQQPTFIYFIVADETYLKEIMPAIGETETELMSEDDFKKLDPLYTKRQPYEFINNYRLLPWYTNYYKRGR
jgi:hypothetical protein